MTERERKRENETEEKDRERVRETERQTVGWREIIERVERVGRMISVK